MSVKIGGMDNINPDHLWEKYKLSCFFLPTAWATMWIRNHSSLPDWLFKPLWSQIPYYGDMTKYDSFKKSFVRTAMHSIVNHNLVVKLCEQYPLIAEAYQEGRVEHLIYPATPLNEVTHYFDVLDAAEDLYGTSEEYVVEIARFWGKNYG